MQQLHHESHLMYLHVEWTAAAVVVQDSAQESQHPHSPN